jgi:tellurite resistance protein TerC
MGQTSIWLWAVFGAIILVMLCLDLGVLNRKAHTPTYKESLIWSVAWVSLALMF